MSAGGWIGSHMRSVWLSRGRCTNGECLPLGHTPWSGEKVNARYPCGSRTGNITGGAGIKLRTVKTGKTLAWPVVIVV